jgi:hypothetical protein
MTRHFCVRVGPIMFLNWRLYRECWRFDAKTGGKKVKRKEWVGIFGGKGPYMVVMGL